MSRLQLQPIHHGPGTGSNAGNTLLPAPPHNPGSHVLFDPCFPGEDSAQRGSVTWSESHSLCAAGKPRQSPGPPHITPHAGRETTKGPGGQAARTEPSSLLVCLFPLKPGARPRRGSSFPRLLELQAPPSRERWKSWGVWDLGRPRGILGAFRGLEGSRGPWGKGALRELGGDVCVLGGHGLLALSSLPAF